MFTHVVRRCLVKWLQRSVVVVLSTARGKLTTGTVPNLIGASGPLALAHFAIKELR